jgi:hypothetical protein
VLQARGQFEDMAERDWCGTLRTAGYDQLDPDQVWDICSCVLDDSAWIWLHPTILIIAHKNWDSLEVRDLGIW